ncbi:hypothetical protein BDP27DRAFT_1319233 [Rhodocollybia butyracea]|uniref:RRM domain-containing protein n=1 Tax=Rhodocollybia butyracea TaxID=206335 RepID=A0A9P5Q386_9AGAR|nr:hypothetical protein BDP27DRAFT_1319233 [Rhodocollybia butyracea]
MNPKIDEPITKRLHVSGLTPNLSPADLSARLSNFGTVKSLDGFGLLDAVGQPRRFGYVTLETTQASLKRCFSTLSGTTYKGAKLRIGEAKPDFAERISKELAEPEPPTKKPRRHHNKFTGVPAADMSLITRENAAQRPKWKVMPSGRVVRTMRMRPGKPLPPLLLPGRVTSERKERQAEKDSSGGKCATYSDTDPPEPLSLEPPPSVPTAIIPSTTVPDPADLASERAQTLSFLNSFLFSSSKEDAPPVDWDSDVELDETNVVEARNSYDVDEGYEVVPRDQDDEGVGMDVDADEDEEEENEQSEVVADIEMEEPQVKPPSRKNALKDLFAPQEDEGGFSLLNHLDIDVDNDFDLEMTPFPTSVPVSGPQSQLALPVISRPRQTPQSQSQTLQKTTIALDPKKPFIVHCEHRSVVAFLSETDARGDTKEMGR